MAEGSPRPSALVELRVLEGPNLYFPRAAIKLTLDVTALAAGPRGRRTPPRRAPRHQLAARRRPDERLPPALADPAGDPARPPGRRRVRHHPARRTRAAHLPARAHRRRLPLARPQPGPRARRGGRLGDRRPRHHRRRRPSSRTPPSRSPPPSAARARPRSGRRVPVVAVTGTNGKTTTSRMIAHIAREAGHLVGWSNTDGIYVDGDPGRGRRLLRPLGCRPRARPPGGRLRRHRDRPRRHPAQGHRPGQQRRLRGHQRDRRPPRPPGHRHRRPARRGQGRGRRGSPRSPAGRCSTPTTRASSRCG